MFCGLQRSQMISKSTSEYNKRKRSSYPSYSPLAPLLSSLMSILLDLDKFDMKNSLKPQPCLCAALGSQNEVKVH